LTSSLRARLTPRRSRVSSKKRCSVRMMIETDAPERKSTRPGALGRR
jgi:hypothetical protein